MTAQPRAGEAKGRAIAFVDAEGGALSALAAAVAGSLGVLSVAATSGDAKALPKEIPTVLEEVGMRPASAEVMTLKALERGALEVVFLGASPPPELEGAARWDVALFAGEGELERLATARIARDRIERRLAQAERAGARS